MSDRGIAPAPRVDFSTLEPPHSPRRRRVPGLWWPMMVLALIGAVYALAYVVIGPPMYPPGFRESFMARPWGIYPHAFFAMFALALGPFQLLESLRGRRLRLHRILGRVYVGCAVMTGLTGVYMALYSYGGRVTNVGFGLLGAALLFTTTMAFARIRGGDRQSHRRWMIRSYALLFAAVALRVEIPILVALYQGSFDPAYRLVSWLCWVPNLLVAEWVIRRSRSGGGAV